MIKPRNAVLADALRLDVSDRAKIALSQLSYGPLGL
jgi:hypothetical protein